VNRRISIIIMNKDSEIRALRDLGAVTVHDADDLESDLAGRNKVQSRRKRQPPDRPLQGPAGNGDGRSCRARHCSGVIEARLSWTSEQEGEL